jgi:hypothetical protein
MMTFSILLYAGSLISISWGVAHIIATRRVVKGFGRLTEDNKRLIQMEWVAEGLTLCFLGTLVLLTAMTPSGRSPASIIVYRTAAAMALALAGWTAVTGARTSIIPIKICPWIMTIVAILFFVGSVL